MRFLIIFLLFSAVCYPKDIRIMMIEAKKKMLFESARKEKEDAEKEARRIQKKIEEDKKALEGRIKRLKEENLLLKKRKELLKRRLEEILKEEAEALKERKKKEEEIQDIIATFRTAIKDMKKIFERSHQSAFLKERLKKVELRGIPGIDEMKEIIDLLFQEIELSGQVRLIKGNFIDRSGKQKKGEILIIGNFEAAYRTEKETGFLIYSEKSHRFFALSKLPSRSIRKKLSDYMDGKSEDVPVDISRGACIRQLSYRLSLIEEIPKGGPIVIPILLIGAVAFALIFERAIYLSKTEADSKSVEKFFFYLSKRQWNECIKMCEDQIKKPIFRVFLSGIKNRNMPREELESILQEAILNEIPKLERFLSTISISAEISPLLGLLGTVTGIINVFHVITFYGTGDPRLMAGGISEALITTMLGLMVAIPVMFFHTVLSRKAERIIEDMEQNAISFVNILFRER